MGKQSGWGWGWRWRWWRRCCRGFESAMHTILPFVCGRCAAGGTPPPHHHHHHHAEAPHVSDNDDDVASSCSGASSSLSWSLSSSSSSSSWWWWGHGHGHGRQRRQLSRRRRGPPTVRPWVTGTLYGSRNGRVRVCIQRVGRSASAATAPLLVLELDLTTRALAKEMRNGVLRISLDCDDGGAGGRGEGEEAPALLSVRLWRMYCNGRSCGFAVRREQSAADTALLELTRSVSAGAGVISIDMEMDDLDLHNDNNNNKKKKKEMTEEVVYLRGRFEHVVGSADCESFHLVTPGGDGDREQPLSIFFFRSCCCSCR